MEEILYKVDHEAVGEEMSMMLMDTDISTYDMFEDLVVAYKHGGEEFRKGMDKALEVLLWKNMAEIVKHMEENCIRKEG